MIAVISFICRPSVLLPAPDEEPGVNALSRSGPTPRHVAKRLEKKTVLAKLAAHDSKTGSRICLENMQTTAFAYFLIAIEARL
ncbi:MAG TPA: hypothetical protein VGI89_01045 [Rhizomicrobium sp.]|jgi:hypothetical protein